MEKSPWNSLENNFLHVFIPHSFLHYFLSFTPFLPLLPSLNSYIIILLIAHHLCKHIVSIKMVQELHTKHIHAHTQSITNFILLYTYYASTYLKKMWKTMKTFCHDSWYHDQDYRQNEAVLIYFKAETLNKTMRTSARISGPQVNSENLGLLAHAITVHSHLSNITSVLTTQNNPWIMLNNMTHSITRYQTVHFTLPLVNYMST